MVKIRGDTVFYDRWRTEYKFRIKTDTLIRADTVLIKDSSIITKTITEKRSLSWWQKTLIWYGVIFIVLFIYALYKTFKKHLNSF